MQQFLNGLSIGMWSTARSSKAFSQYSTDPDEISRYVEDPAEPGGEEVFTAEEEEESNEEGLDKEPGCKNQCWVPARPLCRGDPLAQEQHRKVPYGDYKQISGNCNRPLVRPRQGNPAKLRFRAFQENKKHYYSVQPEKI